jgi:RNA binding exosome subunit
MANNVIKLNCKKQDIYHKLITHFNGNAIYYHTYQLKEERSHRVVLKYLHHSTDVKDIRQELFDLGHTVRN